MKGTPSTLLLVSDHESPKNAGQVFESLPRQVYVLCSRCGSLKICVRLRSRRTVIKNYNTMLVIALIS